MTFVNRDHKKHHRMRQKQWILLLSCVMIALPCLADIAADDRKFADAEKKEIVYRMYAGYKKDFPEVRDISPQQAMELMNQGRAVFVDIRKPAEMAVSTLHGAVSEQDFLNHTDQYKDKTIVGYCTISYRSGVFAREMAEKGIKVVNLQGGILAWILEGGKVYDEGGKHVKRVHVYGDKWDYAPTDYESIKFSLWEQIF